MSYESSAAEIKKMKEALELSIEETLKQLKIMNLYLSTFTDNEFEEEDVE